MQINYKHQLNDLIKLRLKIIRPLLFLTIVPYFCFIGVIAFKPEMFSPFIFDTNISLGIFLGLVLILFDIHHYSHICLSSQQIYRATD